MPGADNDDDLAEPDDDNADDADGESDGEWMDTYVINPTPRPERRFPVWNKKKPHCCGAPPPDFPSICTILLREGVPADYITGHGFCCVLGILRETEPSLVSNPCVVRAGRYQSFFLQFLSNTLSSYVVPERDEAGYPNAPVWLKLVVRCKKSVL